MKSSFKGSFVDLRHWAETLRRAGSDQVLLDLADNIAEECLDLIAEGFKLEQDPAGNPWDAKKYPDGRMTLVGATGNLRRRWHRTGVSPRWIKIAPNESATEYAAYHQGGTGVHNPARRSPIVPIRAKALRFFAGRSKSPIYSQSVEGVKPRRMFPHTRTLPKRWRDAIEECVKDFFEAYFRRLGG